MKKEKAVLLSFLMGLCLFSAVPVLRADIDLPGTYTWSDKLGRGVLNIVGSPVELARTINIQSRVKGPAYGWTVGIAEGLGRMIERLGAGLVDTLTFPFDFPKEDKSPLLIPDYPWQKWDAQYL